MTSDVSSSWGDLGLFSLFRSPFLFPSLLLHAMLFLLLFRAATFSIARQEAPISVQLLDVSGSGSDTKSIGPGKGPGGPRTLPKLGTLTPRRSAQASSTQDLWRARFQVKVSNLSRRQIRWSSRVPRF